MQARIIIEAAGPLTTVQDRGRTGVMRFGVPPSGPVDRLAFAAAMALTAAPEGWAFEISHGGCTVLCQEGEIGFVLCGGGFLADIDGDTAAAWRQGTLHAGQRLRVRAGAGNWAYLAFAGSHKPPLWLGSSATHGPSGLGGGIVAAGAAFDFANARPLEPYTLAPPPEASSAIAAVLGPQDRHFPAEALAHLAQTSFTASARFDRMGRVLGGPPLVPTSISMPSEPALRGCLQTDGDGSLTVLLADHQTTSGYPKIATVISADIDRLAQLPSGQPFRFELIGAREALLRTRATAAANQAWLNSLAQCASLNESLDERLRASNLIDGFIDANRP
ncbi:allophanate hydrolase [Novosphingobium sediminis]|uniref:Allophanate hydrolase n=1 Tax=Novosphingobium sediminis TaxID=707214 RepID=A0A512AJT0_9SPHN|nr:allophanate hydrolase [Novosphingobium sediminis]GEN99940.1 allophanate hydrolase [Novosphingobium sediminis]